MKGSDFIANFLADRGIETTFVLTGGCVIHLIDSIANHDHIDYLPMLHEQSCAMAADAYARVSGNVGVAATTSGPGATNLLTGVCCSYYDSIPVLLITGQVHSSKLKNKLKTRQYGFQETDVVSIYKSVTKYCVQVQDIQTLRYELEAAFWHANHGRPGPVLLDITEDVLYSQVPSQMQQFTPPVENIKLPNKIYSEVIEYLDKSMRPVLVLGAGCRSVDKRLISQLSEKLKIPILLTWGAFDLLDCCSPNFVGGFGVTSQRGGNFTIQNCDLILSIGTRFDTHEIGNDPKQFSPLSAKIVVDIDQGELDKYHDIGLDVVCPINQDAESFVKSLLSTLTSKKPSSPTRRRDWRTKIDNWNQKYPICHEEHLNQKQLINPYVFFKTLSKHLNNNDVIVTDCGSNLIWTMQSLQLNCFDKLISAFNHSPMGYSLPAAIGAYFAGKIDRIICIIGDGGLQINIQELATISSNKIPIKLFVLNNHSHGIIQGTQDNWLEKRHHASCPKDGKLPDPSITEIGRAFGMTSFLYSSIKDFEMEIAGYLNTTEPTLFEIEMLSGSQIEPKLLYGNRLENSHPLLSEEELLSNMI